MVDKSNLDVRIHYEANTRHYSNEQLHPIVKQPKKDQMKPKECKLPQKQEMSVATCSLLS